MSWLAGAADGLHATGGFRGHRPVRRATRLCCGQTAAVYRLYWLVFLLQASVPARVRRGPWTRLLASGHADVHRLPLLLVPLPRLASMAGSWNRAGTGSSLPANVVRILSIAA